MRYSSTCVAVIVSTALTLFGCADPKDEFAKAQAVGSRQAFEQFKNRFPNDPLAAEAQKLIEKSAFDDATRTRDAAVGKKFLSEFPESEYRTRVAAWVEELAYEVALKENKVDAWQA